MGARVVSDFPLRAARIYSPCFASIFIFVYCKHVAKYFSVYSDLYVRIVSVVNA